MNETLYLSYQEWRESMLAYQEDFSVDEADFSVWDAADHQARDDFNLFLASKAQDQVSFTQMKEMEVRYDSEN